TSSGNCRKTGRRRPQRKSTRRPSSRSGSDPLVSVTFSVYEAESVSNVRFAVPVFETARRNQARLLTARWVGLHHGAETIRVRERKGLHHDGNDDAKLRTWRP